MEQSQLLAHCGSSKITREELKVMPTPAGSATHQPLPHFEIVGALTETLSFRQISVVREEYAVSGDGMKMFGVLDLQTTFDGCRFSVGVRNSNDKSMRLALTVGYRVLVCDNMAFHGDFTPVLAKHTKHLSLVDILSVGVDRMQRNFEPMRKQVEAWKGTRLLDDTAKLVIYRAFAEGELDVPKHLARRVHDLYFNPRIEEFTPRTTWSLSNAFTSAFKELDPIPQFRATAKLASFLEMAAGGRTKRILAVQLAVCRARYTAPILRSCGAGMSWSTAELSGECRRSPRVEVRKNPRIQRPQVGNAPAHSTGILQERPRYDVLAV